MRRFFLSLIFFVILLITGSLASFAYLDATIRDSTEPFIYSDVSAIPARTTAMVLGTQVLPGKEPGTVLESRLVASLALYDTKKVSRFLMSGDGRSKYYNEGETMRAYAIDHGVPASAIVLDPNGLRTYSSCYRAKHEFNLESVIIVTQPDHLRRAVYTCRSLGLDAIGLEAPDIEPSAGRAAYLRYKLREKAALVLAWVDVTFLQPSS